jgi:CRP-like cAMP-binding protein
MEMPQEVGGKIERFFSDYPLKQFGKNEILLRADNDPKYIFYLLEGNVREYDISPGGDEIVVNVFKPPAFFPMSWAIAKTPNHYFFQTASKSRRIIRSRNSFI